MIQPHKTAIRRGKPSTPLKDFMCYKDSVISKERMFTFYDHGCGKYDDVSWLMNQGFIANGWDPKWNTLDNPTYEVYKDRDVVTCTYVLNVIPNKKDRDKCLKNAWKSVRKGGLLVLSTRTKKEIDMLAKRNGWKKHKDGYVTKTETFQKGFSIIDLAKLALKNLPDVDSVIPREDKENSYSAIYLKKRKR